MTNNQWIVVYVFLSFIMVWSLFGIWWLIAIFPKAGRKFDPASIRAVANSSPFSFLNPFADRTLVLRRIVIWGAGGIWLAVGFLERITK